MSYKFSGTAGSQALRTAVSSTPFPGAWPLTVAGWMKCADITTADAQPFSLEHDSATGEPRIAISTDVAPVPQWDFFVKTSIPQNEGISINFPLGLSINDWVFCCYVFRTGANRQGYVVHRGRLLSTVVGTTTITYPPFDRITFGYLPFFGNLNDHQGLIGSWGMWRRSLSEPEIIRMGRGEPLSNFRNGMVDMWKFDGRIVSQTVKSLYHKLDLTVTGPPAWDISNEPKLQTKKRPWRAVASSLFPPWRPRVQPY